MENCVEIIKGVLDSDYVHMFVLIPPKLSFADLMFKMKGTSSHMVQREDPQLKKRCWGRDYFSTTNGAKNPDNGHLESDQPVDEKQYELRELFSSRSALIKDRTRLINRLQTQTLSLVRRQTKQRIDQLTRQLKALQQDINARVQDCPSRARANTILRSIPGIGEVAAATILIEMPEIGTLHKKGAACLTGLAPMTRQSGKWRGKATIQGGRKQLRDALYMPALVATRHNPDMRNKYKAMIQQGKPQKVALTAIMRKLIELANVLVKDDREWVPNAT